MAKLTPEQEQQLAELERLRDAPDEPSGGSRDLSIIVDLGDDNAVRRALKLGVLTRGDLAEFDDEPGDDDGDDGDDDGDDDEKPRRKARDDRSPRRRLSIADRAMGVDGE